MTRLTSELHRLYMPHPATGQPADEPAPGLIDAQGRVRAMVLELSRPADWGALSAVWQGVQADLALPAPAIAVSGTDGFQLWFSLAQPVPAAQAWAFMEALRARYLPDIRPERLRLLPQVDGSHPAQHARLIPAPQADEDHWSAFVAPDLAPVFADTPWLDIPPGRDGQADVLAPLRSIQPADFQQALAQLEPAAAQAAVVTTVAPSAPSLSGSGTDPRRFLLDVMNDETVALALRIEAAKALL
ncbi:MAG TPA: hypothetical protein VFW84_11555 [Aquabacterium sp.]|uniref:hypothetical protein n=1 Tax=Aquabacterium sp. TaxID=1872578 RepID=UPI002DA20651|nr:hypothetical protein [Aquabacterium sp.]HET6789190.1 hypothetical protein [Aquabacterium sp.]HEX5373358.1 hypothetical protein [Aquabacterium sp.]